MKRTNQHLIYQPSLFTTMTEHHLDLPDSEIILYENFLTKEEADVLYLQLYRQVKWELRKLFMFGRWVDQPRLTAFYGDEDKNYQYTGTKWEAHPWIKPLAEIKDRLVEFTGKPINGVLCNLYRDGQDSCGWHSDAGKSDGKNPQIYSISLGQTRIFQIKHNTNPEHSLVNIPLTHGSLLLMGGPMQHYWQHAIPKVKGVCHPRINLTFRLTQTED